MKANEPLRLRLAGLIIGLAVGLIWAAATPGLWGFETSARYLAGAFFFTWLGYSVAVVVSIIRRRSKR